MNKILNDTKFIVHQLIFLGTGLNCTKIKLHEANFARK